MKEIWQNDIRPNWLAALDETGLGAAQLIPSGGIFLGLVAFYFTINTFLMLTVSVFSFHTSTLLIKLDYDFVYHALGAVLYFIGGIAAICEDRQKTVHNDSQTAAGAMAFISMILHSLHSYVSFKESRRRRTVG